MKSAILAVCLFCCPLFAQEAPEPPTPPHPPRVRIEGQPEVHIKKMMKIERPSGPVVWLGVAARDVSPEVYQQLDLAEGTGLVVEFVAPEGPAAKAGLQKFDILTKLDDQLLVNPPQLVTLVRSHKEGDKIELTLLRKGKSQKVTATLVKSVMPPMGIEEDDDDEDTPMPPEHFFHGDHSPAPDGKTVEQMKSVIKDGDTTIAATIQSGVRHVTIVKGRKKVYDGPYNTDAEKAKVPADLRERVDKLFERQPPRLEVPEPKSGT